MLAAYGCLCTSFILFYVVLLLVTKCLCECLFLCLQKELDYFGEDPSMSPKAPVQHQQSQPVMHVANSVFPAISGSSCQTIMGQGLRSEHCDNQSKNFVFSNALASPVPSLQHYQIGEGGNYPNGPSTGNGNRSTESIFLHHQSRDSNSTANDSVMDMNAD